MSDTSTKTVMFESDEAATHRTNLEGWVSRHGNYFGNLPDTAERAARYDGCTHRVCDGCGNATEKAYTHCSECRHENDVARYEVMPLKEWDGNTPLYSNHLNEYIFEFYDFLNDYDGDAEALRLVICEPVELTQIDEDYWTDDLAEDYELPDDVAEALEVFNQSLKDAGTVSWRAGKYRTSPVTEADRTER